MSHTCSANNSLSLPFLLPLQNKRPREGSTNLSRANFQPSGCGTLSTQGNAHRASQMLPWSELNHGIQVGSGHWGTQVELPVLAEIQIKASQTDAGPASTCTHRMIRRPTPLGCIVKPFVWLGRFFLLQFSWNLLSNNLKPPILRPSLWNMPAS